MYGRKLIIQILKWWNLTTLKLQAGLPNFVLSATEWLEKTNAIGIIVKKGKYGGTFAHKDIAFEFGSAISVPFKIYLITEFQRLK